MASKHTPYFNLLDALKAPGCALCRLGQRAAAQYLEAILYESVNDAGTQHTLTKAHGLCPTHSEHLLRLRDSLGTAILYNAVLGHLLEELPQNGYLRADWLERLATRLGGTRDRTPVLVPHAICPACRRRDEAADRAIEVFGEHHDDPDLRAALDASSGLCLPHIRQAVETLPGPALQPLLTRQQEAWRALRAQLAELIRKNDYRFRDEGFGEEGDSWIRAVHATAGEPGVF
ncbi:MAG: DUF6062 family protein [Ardenticatenaceae bacterium]|nr:DUF6062 family protein [Ardenticatenaceae bacterium]